MTWSTAVGQQGFFGWMNYGVNGTGGVDGTGDLSDIFTRLDAEQRTQGTSAEAAADGRNGRKYFLDHMRARVVLTNTGTNPIFWEIYECTARKDIPSNEGATLKTFLNLLPLAAFQGQLTGTAKAANTTTQTSASAIPGSAAPGVTPFQYRHFCQNFKITRVTRLQAAAGNTVSFDASNPRNQTVVWDNVSDLIAKKGMSRLYLVRQWGAVVANAGNPTNSASTAVCEVEKDYNVKLLDREVPEFNYITYTNNIES